VSLWDIAPFGVLFDEAGACFTDLEWPRRTGWERNSIENFSASSIRHSDGAKEDVDRRRAVQVREFTPGVEVVMEWDGYWCKVPNEAAIDPVGRKVMP
jgi:hypothetical protein